MTARVGKSGRCSEGESESWPDHVAIHIERKADINVDVGDECTADAGCSSRVMSSPSLDRLPSGIGAYSILVRTQDLCSA